MYVCESVLLLSLKEQFAIKRRTGVFHNKAAGILAAECYCPPPHAFGCNSFCLSRLLCCLSVFLACFQISACLLVSFHPRLFFLFFLSTYFEALFPSCLLTSLLPILILPLSFSFHHQLYFSFSFSAPFLSFSFFSPPPLTILISFPTIPASFLLFVAPGVAEVQWTALPSAVELSPGPSGAQCVYVLQETFFLNQQLQSRTCTAASDLGIHAHTVHTFQNQCWSKIALKEQRGDGVVLL